MSEVHETSTFNAIWIDESAALWIFHDINIEGIKKNTLNVRIPAFMYGVFKYRGGQCDLGNDKRYCTLCMLSRAIYCLADDVRLKLAVGERIAAHFSTPDRLVTMVGSLLACSTYNEHRIA
jgi:hypothetical protein